MSIRSMYPTFVTRLFSPKKNILLSIIKAIRYTINDRSTINVFIQAIMQLFNKEGSISDLDNFRYNNSFLHMVNCSFQFRKYASRKMLQGNTYAIVYSYQTVVMHEIIFTQF